MTMDLFKLKLYVEIGQICILSLMTFYTLPLDILLGDYEGAVRGLIFSILFWTLAWKFNNTLHHLLEKWEWKKK